MAYANAKQKQKQSKEDVKQTWNEISGVMRIYGNTFDGKKKGTSITKWSVSLGIKTDDGYDNYYLPVKFAKDCKRPDGDGLQTINITHAFLSAEKYTNKAGDEIVNPVLIIIECDPDEDIPF